MAATRPTSQKKKTTGLPPPKRGQIKAKILGNLVKAVVSMVKPGDQGKKMATEAALPLKQHHPNVDMMGHHPHVKTQANPIV